MFVRTLTNSWKTTSIFSIVSHVRNCIYILYVIGFYITAIRKLFFKIEFLEFLTLKIISNCYRYIKRSYRDRFSLWILPVFLQSKQWSVGLKRQTKNKLTQKKFFLAKKRSWTPGKIWKDHLYFFIFKTIIKSNNYFLNWLIFFN